MTWPDLEMMKRALALAAQGAGTAAPNPMVGCVVVRDGVEIGRGFHERPGEAHAEVAAIRSVAGGVRGADLYVTLEPCSHSGGEKRTPPCVPFVVESGVKRIAVAMRDPNPRVQGSGIAQLRSAGIEVHEGLCRTEAAELVRGFASRVVRSRPWVIAKWAMSLDGRIATRERDSKWITSDEARSRVHVERSMLDAIMVGVGTVIADDPLLTARPGGGSGAEASRQPMRIVVDPRLRTPLSSKLVRSSKQALVLVACLPSAHRSDARDLLMSEGVEVVAISALESDARMIDLGALAVELGRRGMNTMQIEGGAGLLGAAFDQRLVDEVTAWIAPNLVVGGSSAREAVGGDGSSTIAESIRAARWSHEQIGSDLRIRSFLTDPESLVRR